MSKVPFSFGSAGQLGFEHIVRMAFIMKEDEFSDPVPVGLFGPGAVVTKNLNRWYFG